MTKIFLKNTVIYYWKMLPALCATTLLLTILDENFVKRCKNIDLWDQLHKNFGVDVKEWFFDKFFQISNPDTQSKKCSSAHRDDENVVDCVFNPFWHGYPSSERMAKIFTNMDILWNFFIKDKRFFVEQLIVNS